MLQGLNESAFIEAGVTKFDGIQQHSKEGLRKGWWKGFMGLLNIWYRTLMLNDDNSRTSIQSKCNDYA
jgi:hypothetical protein